MQDVTDSTETIDTADGPMGVFIAQPAAAERGAVVVVQEAFGVTPHIQQVCRWLAGAGWVAVAPTLFHRAGSPVFAYDDIAGAMPVMQTLAQPGIDADLDAVFGLTERLGWSSEQTGLVGFCMGGSVVLHVAGTRAIGAAVTFYGGGLAQGRFGFASGLELAASLRTPWLGLYGDRDLGIPVDDVERVRSIVAGAPVAAEVVRYPEGQHGFNCDDRPAVYDADIATDARARTLAWFDTHLAPA